MVFLCEKEIIMQHDPFIPDAFIVENVFQPIADKLKRWTNPTEIAESMLMGSFVLLSIWCINIMANTYARDGVHNTLIISPLLLLVIIVTGLFIRQDYRVLKNSKETVVLSEYFCSKRITLLISFIFMLFTNDKDFFYSVMTCFWVPLWSAGLYFASCKKE